MMIPRPIPPLVLPRRSPLRMLRSAWWIRRTRQRTLYVLVLVCWMLGAAALAVRPPELTAPWWLALGFVVGSLFGWLEVEVVEERAELRAGRLILESLEAGFGSAPPLRLERSAPNGRRGGPHA